MTDTHVQCLLATRTAARSPRDAFFARTERCGMKTFSSYSIKLDNTHNTPGRLPLRSASLNRVYSTLITLWPRSLPA